MLRTGAILNFIIALGHIVCLFFLDAAFQFYGIDGIMNDIAWQYGTYVPYLITVVLVCGFTVFGLYGLSADGVIRRLPLLWVGVFGIASLYLLRAFWGAYTMVSTDTYMLKNISSAVISGLIGLLYLCGGIKKTEIKNCF